MGIRGEIYSTKVSLENRTYFFNVKENRLGDLYLNIVESKNKDAGGFDRQSVVLFADDLQEFLKGFDDSLKVMEKAVHEKRKSGAGFKGGDRPPRTDRGPREYGESDRERKPFDREPKSREREPFDPNRRPFDGDKKPFDRDRKPFDRDRKPFDRDRKPFDRDRKPFDRDRKPFDRDKKPFDRDKKPFDRDRKPFDRDRPAFGAERKPFDRDRKPFSRDRPAFGADRKPFGRDRPAFDADRKPFGRGAAKGEDRPFKKFVKTGGAHKRVGAHGTKKGPRKARAVRAVRKDGPDQD